MRVGSAPQCEVNFSFFFFTFHESAQRKRKFVPWLFVYSLYTFSSPDGLRSSGLYFSSACLACFFFVFAQKEDVGGWRERISEVLFTYMPRRALHSGRKSSLKIDKHISWSVAPLVSEISFCLFVC